MNFYSISSKQMSVQDFVTFRRLLSEAKYLIKIAK